MIEETLVLVKPDAVQRGLVGEVIHRFEQRGLKIKGMKMEWIDGTFSKKHYEAHVAKKFYPGLEEFITSGPLVAMVIAGVDAVKGVRKIVGDTEPHSSPPGTIRGDFAHVSYSHADEKGKSIANLIHASGNAEEARKEIKLWFTKEELHDYTTVHEKHVF